MTSPAHRAQLPFLESIAERGDHPALVTADRELTYRELDVRVSQVAARLRPGRARRLALVGGANRVESVVAYLGVLRAGHAALLVDGDDPAAVRRAEEQYDPDVLVCPAEPGGDEWAITERRVNPAHDLHPELALLLGTSGSTGSPKVVRLSYDNLQSNADAIASYLAIRPTDRAATTLPIHYAYGLSVVHSHLAAGASLLVTELSVVDPCFWDLFRVAGATSLAGVPYTFDLLDRAGFADIHVQSLRYVTQAGGRLAPDRVRAYAELGRKRGWELFVMYGQTEATARMAYLPPALAAVRPETIGRAIPGGAFRIDPVADCSPGTGELVYRGPNVMLGYATGPEHLALGRTVDELRTGDLARDAGDGLYELVGRRRDFVKVAGLRIDLGQVQQNLAAAGLTAICSGRDEQLVVAVETARDVADVQAIILDMVDLPRRAVTVLCVAKLPRLASGKPDRAAVLALADDAAADAISPAPVAATGASAGAAIAALY